MEQKQAQNPISILKSAYNALLTNPVILFPFAVIAFIQVLVLEIIFFAPRYPLNIFFGPIIKRVEGEIFLHYPFNYILLTKWFQSIQWPIYILINCFFIGMAIAIINALNNERKIQLKTIFRETLGSYIHLIIAAVISVGLMKGFALAYNLLIQRALAIRSTSGIFFLIKKTVLEGAPYFNLIFAVLITALFAFVIPIIIVDNKKILAAIIQNFKVLWGNFWLVVTIVLLPALLYIPILLIRTNDQIFEVIQIPELWGALVIFSLVVTLFIDALQYTAITTYYLIKKES